MEILSRLTFNVTLIVFARCTHGEADGFGAFLMLEYQKSSVAKPIRFTGRGMHSRAWSLAIDGPQQLRKFDE